VLKALAAARASSDGRTEVREVPLSRLQVGMLFAEDVQLVVGTLLAARGYEVTAGFIERIRNFRRGTIKEPVRVIVPPSA
jgi:hypothetical protein